ncbi:MAG TPA: hypothetical protein VHL79_09635 [Ramlibacter sp.]|jgi:hypothetical protein|nr:hypothetical protein [Ramlibacter sp.]
MDADTDIAKLRARVTLLVEQEAAVLQQALLLSRSGAERAKVDALLNQVNAIQQERTTVRQQISQLLGAKRMYSAAEVWQPGVYEYRQNVGAGAVRVVVTQGSLGLQVQAPGEPAPVRIDRMAGFFEGPMPDDANILRPHRS